MFLGGQLGGASELAGEHKHGGQGGQRGGKRGERAGLAGEPDVAAGQYVDRLVVPQHGRDVDGQPQPAAVVVVSA
jgi:hypothetical protein